MQYSTARLLLACVFFFLSWSRLSTLYIQERRNGKPPFSKRRLEKLTLSTQLCREQLNLILANYLKCLNSAGIQQVQLPINVTGSVSLKVFCGHTFVNGTNWTVYSFHQEYIHTHAQKIFTQEAALITHPEEQNSVQK